MDKTSETILDDPKDACQERSISYSYKFCNVYHIYLLSLICLLKSLCEVTKLC